MVRDPILEMRKVTVTRGDTSVLHDIDLMIDEGEKLAVIGPNGSGKSSLIRTMMGEYLCDTSIEGSWVKLFGKDLWDVFEIRKAFGLVSSDLQITMTRDMDVTDAVLSGVL